MEGASQRDFKSSYKDVPRSGENPEGSRTDHPSATTRAHHRPHPGTLKQLPSVLRDAHGPSFQPPDKGRITIRAHNAGREDHNNDIDSDLKSESDSESSQRCRSSEKVGKRYGDSVLPNSSSSCENDDVLRPTSRMSNTPLIGELDSRSAECNTTQSDAPVFDLEETSDQTNGMNEFATVVSETAYQREGNPKPCIPPAALSAETGAEATGCQILQHPSAITMRVQETEHEPRHLNQTDPPHEITLQPSDLAKYLYKPQRNKGNVLEYGTHNHTPPPSYQESLSYPVVNQQPLPEYPRILRTCPTTTNTNTAKDSRVSIIQLTSPPLVHQPTSGVHSTNRDSVFVWHSPSSDVCNRDNNAQDQYSDHQILALLACIMFWPVGLLAIYYANMANILRSEGVHTKSLVYSKRALLLSLISFMIGTGVYLTFYLQRQITI